MKRANIHIMLTIALTFVITVLSLIFAKIKEAPSNIIAALFLKQAVIEKNLFNSKGNISIYVIIAVYYFMIVKYTPYKYLILHKI